jgi:hypothetical protein
VALALIYLFATAKPISIRRLSALFILTLILTITLLSTLRVQNVRADALFAAGSLTLLVWIVPPLQVLFDTMRSGSLRLDALECVSSTIQWSYAFMVAVSPFAILLINGAPPHLHLASLATVLVVVGVLAFVLQIGLRTAHQSAFYKESRPRTKLGRRSSL